MKYFSKKDTKKAFLSSSAQQTSSEQLLWARLSSGTPPHHPTMVQTHPPPLETSNLSKQEQGGRQ